MMSMSGIEPGARSTTKSSIAKPGAFDDIQREDVGTDADNEANASDPRLPGRS